MSTRGTEAESLAGFADAHGLSPAADGELPRTGALLGRDSLVVVSSAEGTLPGAIEGTAALLSYEYRSDDTTRTRRVTAVVTRVPESIGFAPYLADGGARLHGIAAGLEAKKVKLGDSVSVYADDGIDEAWLHELLSPALIDWLGRSPDDFAFELAAGVLTVSREGFLTTERDLTRLCEDAAHLADAIREESLEEFDSGTAESSAAKTKRDPQQLLIEQLLPLVEFEQPPANVAEAVPVFRELVIRHPSTYFLGLFMGLVWALVINVIGGGIFGLLLNIPNPLLAVAIFEFVVIGLTTFLSIRHEINSRSAKLAREAFWREYARARGLEPVDPRSFAATHAKAELPAAPQRVLAGPIGGVDGALMISGDGLKRGDSIALVAGPAGPVASAEFTVSAPGPSLIALDDYAAKLAAELRG